jgi:hypothetical protein
LKDHGGRKVAGSTTEDLHPYHVTLTMLLEDKTDNYTKKRIFVRKMIDLQHYHNNCTTPPHMEVRSSV